MIVTMYFDLFLYPEGHSCHESGSARTLIGLLIQQLSSAKASCAFRRMDCVPPTSARSRPFGLCRTLTIK